MADPPRRVNFFPGMVLTVADLATEQEYHRGMRYLHNRLHGYGTVSGLEVAVVRGRVMVGPGLAIDVCGREVIVVQPLSLSLELRRNAGGWVRDLVIEWHEAADSPVPSAEGATDFTRWVEEPELSLVACGEAASEVLVLARLARTTLGEVDVDSSVRRTWGPG